MPDRPLQVTEAGVEETEREPVPPANTEVFKEPAGRVTPTQGLRASRDTGVQEQNKLSNPPSVCV